MLIAHSGKLEMFENSNGSIVISLGYDGSNHRKMVYSYEERCDAFEVFYMLANGSSITWH